MRAYSLAMAFGLLLAIMVGLQLLAQTASAQIYYISATIDIQPKTLNLMEKGVITAYIWLQGYDVNQINVSTVLFDGQIPALTGKVEGGKMIVKFDASSVTSYIWTNKVYHMGSIPPQDYQMISIMITGSLFTGECFRSQDYMLKVIRPQTP